MICLKNLVMERKTKQSRFTERKIKTKQNFYCFLRSAEKLGQSETRVVPNVSKVREMQNSSEVFESNFDYYQRVAHKKLS